VFLKRLRIARKEVRGEGEGGKSRTQGHGQPCLKKIKNRSMRKTGPQTKIVSVTRGRKKGRRSRAKELSVSAK